MRELETSLQQFGEFVLKAQLVKEKAAPYCVRWVRRWATFEATLARGVNEMTRDETPRRRARSSHPSDTVRSATPRSGSARPRSEIALSDRLDTSKPLSPPTVRTIGTINGLTEGLLSDAPAPGRPPGHSDRQGDRIQVFRKEGTFVKEAFVAKETRDAGSVWDIAFSADAAQTYLYVGDGENELVHILRRDTLEELTAFGDGGRQPGQFYGVHVIASDSKGNLFTAETYEGHRVQKFVDKGIGPVTKKYQGVLWPSGRK